jgi:voltage-gated potassium channel
MMVIAVVKRFLRIFSQSNTRILLLVTLIVLVFGSVGGFLAESRINDDFQSIWDGLWWTVVTMSTVGYGDKTPITTLGRIIGTICMISGPLLLVSLVGSFGITIYNKWTRGMRGMNQIKAKNHLVLCGWNSTAKEFIEELRLNQNFKDCPIIIIDEGIETKPLDYAKVEFVHGNPSETEVLKRANIGEAKYAIIMADNRTPVADQKTVLTVLAIEQANPAIISCAELNDINNEEHLRRAGCDLIINPTAMTSKLLAMSLQNPASSNIIKELISQTGSEIYRVEIPEQYVGLSFTEVLTMLNKSKGMIVIGIERMGNCLINPPTSLTLVKDDLLMVISTGIPVLND